MIYHDTRGFKSYLKNMIQKFFLLFLFLFLSLPITSAKDCEMLEDEFEKYECRSDKICKQYDENKKVFNTEKFKNVESYKEVEIGDILLTSGSKQKWIQKAVEIYKQNMNSIYKCGIIGAQKNSLRRLLELPIHENVKKSIEPKIHDIIKKLDITANSQKCLNIDTQTVFNKLGIFRQTTFLTCDYSFYMEYLKDYYNHPAHALGVDPKERENQSEEIQSYSLLEAADKITAAQKNISQELTQAYKVFPIAFHAYSEYENNFPIHFLLELLKEDYYILREKLHEVLNPINQVVYKISNAMKK